MRVKRRTAQDINVSDFQCSVENPLYKIRATFPGHTWRPEKNSGDQKLGEIFKYEAARLDLSISIFGSSYGLKH